MNDQPQKGEAILNAAGQSAQVDATYDPTTGTTDLDGDSLNRAFEALEPAIAEQQRDGEAFLQAFDEAVTSDIEIISIGQFINMVSMRADQLRDDES